MLSSSIHTKNIKVLCNAEDVVFTQTICKQLNLPLGLCHIRHFPNGETLFQLLEPVDQAHVIIIKRFSSHLHRNIWELLQTIKDVRQHHALSLSLVLPYLPYSRQSHCKTLHDISHTPLFIDLLKHTGADRIITIDIHDPEQCAHWPVPVINISIEPFWINYLQTLNLDWDNISIFGADKSAAARAENIAKYFKCTWGFVDKQRDNTGNISILGIHGNCCNKHVILIDDLIDTGNTIIQGATYLKNAGALDISVLATHCHLDKNPLEKLALSPIDKLIVTDTLLGQPDIPNQIPIEIPSTTPLLTKAISDTNKSF